MDPEKLNEKLSESRMAIAHCRVYAEEISCSEEDVCALKWQVNAQVRQLVGLLDQLDRLMTSDSSSTDDRKLCKFPAQLARR